MHGLETRISAQKVSIQHPHDVDRALVASERKLPPEMLSEVFGHFLAGSLFSLHEDQLLLMQVCRRWRRIAASTPSLWTEISLPLAVECTLNPCRAICMGVANSGALPMTVNIYTHEYPDQWNEREVIRLLAENFHRFRHFGCKEGDELYRGIFGRETLIHAPLLESFVIDRLCLDTPSTSSAECIRAPRLKSISLPHASLMSHISFNPMSLCDLTLAIEETKDILPSLHILTSCPNIRVLKLSLYEVIEPPEIEGRPRILLPFLNNLSVEFDDSTRCALLQTIEAPELQKLSISPNDVDRAPALSLLSATLDSLCGHSSPLQDLHLSSVHLDDGLLLTSVLDRLENLRSLTLQNCTINDYILEFLTPNISSPASDRKCPSLSVLDVSFSSYSLDLFLRLVRSRVSAKPGGTVDGRYLQCVVVPGSRFHGRDAFIAGLKDIIKSCGGDLMY